MLSPPRGIGPLSLHAEPLLLLSAVALRKLASCLAVLLAVAALAPLVHVSPAGRSVYLVVLALLSLSYARLFRDRWRLVAPDHPGFGHSATPDPDRFPYTFDAYAQYLRRFVDVLGLQRYVIYLHDYGSQFGLRLAMAEPARVAGLIIQNIRRPRAMSQPAFWALMSSAAAKKIAPAVRGIAAWGPSVR